VPRFCACGLIHVDLENFEEDIVGEKVDRQVFYFSSVSSSNGMMPAGKTYVDLVRSIASKPAHVHAKVNGHVSCPTYVGPPQS
jgi:hypothetical protein